jgi:hypothetical protein
MRLHSFREQGATQWLVGGVTLRNAGPPCSLLGRARLSVTYAGRSIVATSLRPGHIASQDLAPDALPPTYSLRAIPTGAYAFFGYQWANWCAGPRPLLTMRFPGGGAARFPAAPPTCTSVPKAPPVFEAGRFVQWGPAPSQATELPFTIGYPQLRYRVPAGGVLRYRVTMRNVGKRTYTFAECPAYQESLSLGRIVREDHILNCAATRTFAPGQARIFEMRMRIPRGAAGRRSPIFFELGLGTYSPPGAPISRQAVVDVS